MNSRTTYLKRVNRKMHRYTKVVISIICTMAFIFACKTEHKIEEPYSTKHSVKDSQVFLNADDSLFLGRPTSLKAVSDGLFIVDMGRYQITKVDEDKNRILSFGRNGRGPGEFQVITGFWPIETEYLVYDYNSFKFLSFDQNGQFLSEKIIKENPANPNSKRSIPITLDVISSDTILIPTVGRHGSLFAIANIENNDVIYAGTAISEFMEETNNQNSDQAYAKGEIPDIHLNLVMLSNSSSAIYSFQQTTGVLEKYSYSGQKIWERKVNVPAQRNLFEQIAEYNRTIGRKFFIYARAMEAHNDGVAILLNTPKSNLLTLAWIPKDGSKVDIVEVEGITLDSEGFMEGFTISPDKKYAYYLKRSKGVIYQFKWPIKE